MKPLIIFDQECPLCVRFKQSLLFLDRGNKFDFAPLQDETIYIKYPILSREECEKDIHILIDKNEVVKGTEALEFLIKNYPKVKSFAWLLESDSGKKAVNLFHDKVSELRQAYKKNCPGCAKKRMK
jgi:predicted DCC family thiol-disulfide oxidoreductase YuxK